MGKTPTLAEQLMEAIERNRLIPPKKRFQALIDRGAIDENGNVLIKGPEEWCRSKKEDEH